MQILLFAQLLTLKMDNFSTFYCHFLSPNALLHTRSTLFGQGTYGANFYSDPHIFRVLLSPKKDVEKVGRVRLGDTK